MNQDSTTKSSFIIHQFAKITEQQGQFQNVEKANSKDVNIQQQEIVSLIDKPYEILTEYTKKQSPYCCAIAFNSQYTVMITGCESTIIVFEFELGQLNQKQLLSYHNSDYHISTLYFMRQYNQFVSGTYEQIGIWSYNNETQQYYCLQMLKQAHSDYVKRVIMNKNENLIISCSNDQTIKFWIRKYEWVCLQTLSNHTNCVYDLCLNESCTQLVSCDRDGYILISQQGVDQKWRKFQRIKSICGYRICYIKDNLIVFQPRNGTKMEIYQLNQQNKQFIKYKDLSVQNDSRYNNWFPMQFNNKKQILLNKNGHRINLIRYHNNDFIIEQSINFGTQFIYGAMTDDFQYLVTYDEKSEEFQVRKQK